MIDVELETRLSEGEGQDHHDNQGVIHVSHRAQESGWHDVVGQQLVHKDSHHGFQEDGAAEEEEQELVAEEIIHDPDQHERKFFDGSFNRPVVSKFAIVLGEVMPDLCDLLCWLFLLEGLEERDDVFAAEWTIDPLIHVLSIVAENAICAEGVRTGGHHSVSFGFCEANTADVVVHFISFMMLVRHD